MSGLDLGLSQEELREQVIERASEKIAGAVRQEGLDPIFGGIVQETAAEVARKVADEELRPWVEQEIDQLVMQKTNEWGEAVGKPQTFREFVVAMAERYLEEPVNYEGKTRKEARGMTFQAKAPRLAFMVDRQLHIQIEGAIRAALKNANERITDSIQETVKLKLRELSDALKVEVKR